MRVLLRAVFLTICLALFMTVTAASQSVLVPAPMTRIRAERPAAGATAVASLPAQRYPALEWGRAGFLNGLLVGTAVRILLDPTSFGERRSSATAKSAAIGVIAALGLGLATGRVD